MMKLNAFGRFSASCAFAILGFAVATPATAAESFNCPGVTVTRDEGAPAFAMARGAAGGGVEIAVNAFSGGIGLSEETKFWLFARQCFLARQGGEARKAPAILHLKADCVAFDEVRKRFKKGPGAVAAVESDLEISNYWDPSLGEPRRVSPRC